MNQLAVDLDHILVNTQGLWEELRGQRIFITGGTGFFGTWLLESFAWANEKNSLGASMVVLTRDQEKFKNKSPHLAADPAIKFHVGDIRDFQFPAGEFSLVIHAAATSAVATFNNEDYLVKFDTVVQGTRRVLDFAVHCHAKKLLLTSSGAVYGKQSAEIAHLFEDYCGAPSPNDVNSVWGESKRVAELLCMLYSKKYDFEAKIARCFTFIGPHLPLDIHYAAGNFIRDAINGGPIQVNGDGTPHRSYLYVADLMIWLWTILFKGQSCRPYNVGSEEDITIAELANIVAHCFQDTLDVKIAKSAIFNAPAERYVPSANRAQAELGLRQTVDIEEAIKRTAIFVKSNI